MLPRLAAEELDGVTDAGVELRAELAGILDGATELRGVLDGATELAGVLDGATELRDELLATVVSE